jgi:phosphoketolase
MGAAAIRAKAISQAGNWRRNHGNQDTYSGNALQDRCLLARRQLSFGGADVSLRQSAAQEANGPFRCEAYALGHWGTTPGRNFVYTHLNRIFKKYDLDMIYVSGPGHGGPAQLVHGKMSHASPPQRRGPDLLHTAEME